MKKKLPIEAEELIPHRPPMLLARRLLERDPLTDTELVEAEAPARGRFNGPGPRPVPEYYIELGAQAAGMANGYDRLLEGAPDLRGFLIGLDQLEWLQDALPGIKLFVHLEKKFEFGNIKIITVNVADCNDLPFFQGTIKVWEEK
ncbi:MAG: ACP dehydratase [Thermodesulfobacteriota bacterium]